MLPRTFHAIALFTALLLASEAAAQKAVGDTLRFSVMTGGSVTVPAGEEWCFVSLSYSEGGYGMRTTYNGPDTLKEKQIWAAPMWNVESHLLGNGKGGGMYELRVVRVK